MTIGKLPAYVPTGKENALYSLAKYLTARFSEVTPAPSRPVTIIDTGYEQTLTYPCVTIGDTGLPQLTDEALGREIGLSTLGVRKRGRTEQTLVEINVLDCVTDTVRDAELNARRLRDQVKYAIQMSGMDDGNGGQILPPIRLLDAQNSDADTGSIVSHPRAEAAVWNETYIKDNPQKPNEKRYRIFCRIRWEWFE